jgi:hypothetical protein
MKAEEIIGKKIKEVYETDPSFSEDVLGLGIPHYFTIVIELEDNTKFELGVHEIKPWDSRDKLNVSTGSAWALDRMLEYKNHVICQIIQRDPEEYVDGSLTLVLENNVIIEHQCSNGSQLFIDSVPESDNV